MSNEQTEVMAVVNQKGGVGKTTTVLNLGVGLQRKGKKTLILDLDPQGNATEGFLSDKNELKSINNTALIYDGEAPTPLKVDDNLYLLGSNRELARASEKPFDEMYYLAEYMDILREEDWDYILLDPIADLNKMFTSVLLAADSVLIPMEPEFKSLSALGELLRTIKNVQKPRMNPDLKVLGIVLNRVSPRITQFEPMFLEELKEDYSNFLLNTVIHESIKIKEAYSLKQGIVDYLPNSKSSLEYHQLVDEVLEKVYQLSPNREETTC